MKKRAGHSPDQGPGLHVTSAAAHLAAQQARGRALVIEFREVDQGGCCSSGALVKLNWHDVAAVHNKPDMVSAGDAGGVPLFCHQIIARFLREHRMEIVRRSLGPIRWLALRSERDPAMWSIFGDDLFGGGPQTRR